MLRSPLLAALHPTTDKMYIKMQQSHSELLVFVVIWCVLTFKTSFEDILNIWFGLNYDFTKIMFHKTVLGLPNQNKKTPNFQ